MIQLAVAVATASLVITNTIAFCGARIKAAGGEYRPRDDNETINEIQSNWGAVQAKTPPKRGGKGKGPAGAPANIPGWPPPAGGRPPGTPPQAGWPPGGGQPGWPPAGGGQPGWPPAGGGQPGWPPAGGQPGWGGGQPG
ncbi:hypothetical protein TELCIR_15331, partial [Teladorsagia circumcincta]